MVWCGAVVLVVCAHNLVNGLLPQAQEVVTGDLMPWRYGQTAGEGLPPKPSFHPVSRASMDYSDRKGLRGRYYPEDVGDSYGHYIPNPYHDDVWSNYEVTEVIPGDKRRPKPNQGMVVPFPPCFYGPRPPAHSPGIPYGGYLGYLRSPRGGSSPVYRYTRRLPSRDYRMPGRGGTRPQLPVRYMRIVHSTH
ncbi:hypothetical protein AAG570_010925 [Ranatra chinensis]|uniref:Uncharacterized protein n=1 Tax=Ranatra chinensis TaxID=642074 RepID=A0ABD0YVC7_9HEMI